MANDSPKLKDTAGRTFRPLTLPATLLDGEELDASENFEIQALVPALVDADGNVVTVGAGVGLPTADASPPLTALSHIGDDIDPSTDTTVAAAVAGRVKVELCHAGDAGKVWIGVGQAAQVDVGNYLEPGDVWSEYTADAVHVLLAETGSAQRVTGMEWAA